MENPSLPSGKIYSNLSDSQTLLKLLIVLIPIINPFDIILEMPSHIVTRKKDSLEVRAVYIEFLPATQHVFTVGTEEYFPKSYKVNDT